MDEPLKERVAKGVFLRGPVLGLIPARGGSKRLPGKNLMKLGGRTLIERTVDAAAPVIGLDNLCLSSDSEDILAEGRRLGIRSLMRPAPLATSTSTAKDVALHVLDTLPQYRTLLYLQPTSPFRTSDMIRTCLLVYEKGDSNSVLTVQKSPLAPEDIWALRDGKMVRSKSIATQPLLPNGAVYVCGVDALCRDTSGGFMVVPSRTVVMTPEQSVDIDTAEDFTLAKALVDEA